jgi:hypothetical protein
MRAAVATMSAECEEADGRQVQFWEPRLGGISQFPKS